MLKTLLIAILLTFTTSLKIQSIPLSDFMYKQIRCMSLNLYHEARGENILGIIAVGNVVLNRVKLKNESICEIVYANKQFSWTNNLHKKVLPASLKTFDFIAYKIINNNFKDFSKGAKWYHSTSIKPPSWTKKMIVTVRIGNHIFYKEKDGSRN
jgi:N-acetylmuramoyl-L-alanine amidase